VHSFLRQIEDARRRRRAAKEALVAHLRDHKCLDM